jgi:inner membrane protein
MDGFAAWVIWGLIAAVLLAVEMVTVAYVALGFAIGAGAVALVVYFAPGLHVFVQALIWAGMGLAVWLALSRRNTARHKARPDINDFDSLDSLPPEDRARRAALRKGQEK